MIDLGTFGKKNGTTREGQKLNSGIGVMRHRNRKSFSLAIRKTTKKEMCSVCEFVSFSRSRATCCIARLHRHHHHQLYWLERNGNIYLPATVGRQIKHPQGGASARITYRITVRGEVWGFCFYFAQPSPMPSPCAGLLASTVPCRVR